MKISKRHLLLFLLSLFIISKASTQNYVFNKKFCEKGQLDDYSDFTITQNGTVFLVGTDPDSLDGTLYKLDKNFNPIWKKMYGGTGFDRFWSITYLDQSRLLVIGQSNSQDGDVIGNYPISKNCWICIIDTNGNILHQVIYGGAYSTLFDFAKVAPNGDLFFCGNTYGDTLDFASSAPFDFHDDGFLICTDSLLNKKYIHFFDVVNGDSRVHDLDFLPNGHLLVVASSNVLDGALSVNTPTPKGATVLMEIDTTGNIFWQKRYGAMGSPNVGGTMSKIAKDPNKWEYMLMGSTAYKDGDCWDTYPYLNKGGGTYMWFMKVDTLGNKVWSHIFGSFSDDATVQVKPYLNYNPIEHCALVTSSTNGIDSFAMGDSIGRVDTWIYQINMDGQMIKNFRAGYDGSSWLPYYNSKVSPYDSLVYYRHRQFIDTTEMYTSYPHACDTQKLVEYTIIGTYDYWPNATNEHIKEIKSFKIYPNPAREVIHIEELPIGCKMVIRDMEGRKMYSQKTSSTKISIPTTNWKSGIYILTVEMEKSKYSQKFSIQK